MKWHVKVECAGQCKFKHEWTGEAENSLDAKQRFMASLGNKDMKLVKHMGHEETKICELAEK